MDALVMAGGQGTRLERSVEKPLLEVGGQRMIDRVLTALEASDVCQVAVAISPHAPNTGRIMREAARSPDGVVDTVIETAGDGYVADLLTVLEEPTGIDPPVLTVVSDLPLLTARALDTVLERYRRAWSNAESLTVCVPVALKRQLGFSVDTTLETQSHLTPTGVNIVSEGERDNPHISYDPRLAANINRPEDVAALEALGGRFDGGQDGS